MSARIASSIDRLSTEACTLRRVDVLDVGAVERCGHRPHVTQRVGDLLDVPARLEHAGSLRSHVRVVGKRVPRSEHDVVERGEWNEVADEWAAVVGAFAEADRVHQRQRADRLGESALDELDAGDQRRGDGAEPDGEDPETAVGWRDLGVGGGDMCERLGVRRPVTGPGVLDS